MHTNTLHDIREKKKKKKKKKRKKKKRKKKKKKKRPQHLHDISACIAAWRLPSSVLLMSV